MLACLSLLGKTRGTDIPMKIAYFDCIGGASGDMILGALLDAGLPLQVLQDAIAALDLPGCTVEARKVVRGGLAATQAEVLVSDLASERAWPEVERLVLSSRLDASVKETAHHILQRIAAVEARLHQIALDRVHLHELGSLDTIVDVVGAVAGLQALGVEAVVVSPLPLGRGQTRSAHGPLPLPAPAALELIKGAPVQGVDIEGELVTPTGAAILSTLAREYGPLPAMRVQAIGYGAGQRNLSVPNVLRLVIGETESGDGDTVETLAVLETNIDDMNPQAYDHIMARLFAAGALDVYLTPIHMKKNRPGILLTVLCRPADAAALTDLLFAETTTLGVRQQTLVRRCLSREIVTVATRFGPVRMKVARMKNGQVRAVPEYDDCHRIALERGVTWREVVAAAQMAWERSQSASPSP